MRVASPMKLALASAAVMAAGCATVASVVPEPSQSPRKENIYAVTASNKLVSFNAGTPGNVVAPRALGGLDAGDSIVGIDYRVARGVLYALSRNGRLYTVDTNAAALRPVGADKLAVALDGNEFGMDFNPAVDRIRIVSDNGQNLRLHPDTGAVIDANLNESGIQTDGKLAYDNTDPKAGTPVMAMAAAYTYTKQNDKITTNYAIDGRQGLLVTQGTKEGVSPAVSPNTGRLFTVGALGVSEAVGVAFDIADVNNAAFAAITTRGAKESRLYLVDLASGKATLIGTIAAGETIRGIAIEP